VCDAFLHRPPVVSLGATSQLNLEDTRLYLSSSGDALNSADGFSVSVYPTADDVGEAVCKDFLRAAKESISRHDRFLVAVPGGSVLKMLGNLKKHTNAIDYSKVSLFYVNHKLVSNSDPTATHLKARNLFLDAIPAMKAFPIADINPSETRGHDTDAHAYEKSMRSVFTSKEIANGLPVFDYMLLGMGADGHVGSLYPKRPRETQYRDHDRWVLTVDKKTPASITLSLPVMNNAREVRVVLCGADKAEAVLAGVTRSKATEDFPACGVTRAEWIIDDAAAKLLSASGRVAIKHH
jgi:6-phosphogluconolactonase